jgi:hypothetical protein
MVIQRQFPSWYLVVSSKSKTFPKLRSI